MGCVGMPLCGGCWGLCWFELLEMSEVVQSSESDWFDCLGASKYTVNLERRSVYLCLVCTQYGCQQCQDHPGEEGADTGPGLVRCRQVHSQPGEGVCVPV